MAYGKVEVPFHVIPGRLSPLKLPPRNIKDSNYYKGEMATVAGWGITKYDKYYKPSNVLLKATMRVMDVADCKRVFRSSLAPYDSKMCATTDSKTINVCKGDRGAPLVVKGMAVGILIASMGKCNAGHPAAFIYTGYYLDWIYKITGIRAKN